MGKNCKTCLSSKLRESQPEKLMNIFYSMWNHHPYNIVFPIAYNFLLSFVLVRVTFLAKYTNKQIQKQMKNKVNLRFHSSYTRADKTKMFVYLVSGKKDALEAYAEYQGDYKRHQDDDETKPMLYFTKKYAGNTAILDEGENGWYLNTEEQDKLASLLAQHAGTPMGDALAAQLAAKLLAEVAAPVPAARTIATPAPAVQAQAVVAQEPVEAPSELDGM